MCGELSGLKIPEFESLVWNVIFYFEPEKKPKLTFIIYFEQDAVKYFTYIILFKSYQKIL